ncbi:MAG: hypothetical protein HOV80_30435 [Polyangiaceae bacterium]|nr:hypothetical protein [Polyangiaceae bacterium]
MLVPETSPKLNSAWAALATALNLRAHLACSDYYDGDGFRQVRSRLGMAAVAPKLDDYLWGAHEGAEVILASYKETAKLSDFGVNTSDGVARFVAVLVALDPPLFMGTRVSREGMLSNMFGGSDVQLGVPEIDRALRLTSLDADKLRALLAPASAQDQAFLGKLSGLAGGGLYVTDSFVGYRLPGSQHDPAMVGACIANAVWVRNELAARAARVPKRPHEVALAESWAGVARAASLAFDEARFSLQGVVDGVALEIALSPTAGAPMTSVSVRWPRPIGVQLRLSKFDPAKGADKEAGEGAHRVLFQFLTDVIAQDIRVGDPKFDDAFLVQGFPEDHVRSALSSPSLRDAMVRIAKVATEVSMTDQGITWFIQGQAKAAELDEHIRMAVHTAGALFPALDGPAYR